MHNPKKIKNIIFDLGGVLLDIQPQNTVSRFRELSPEIKDAALHEFFTIEPAFIAYEIGKISTKEFIVQLKQNLLKNAREDEIIEAWNRTIIDIQPDKIELLHRLKTRYNLYVLSNTNGLHKTLFYNILHDKYNLKGFSGIIKKEYYSHEIGSRKPDHEIYQHVIDDGRIRPEESLFIDDSHINIENAKKVGILTHHHQKNDKLVDFFTISDYI